MLLDRDGRSRRRHRIDLLETLEMVPARGLELTCERSYDQKRVFSFHKNIYKFLARSKRARREDLPPSGTLAIHAKSYRSLPN